MGASQLLTITRSQKRRCVECEKTFSATKGTPYYRLQHRRATFDTVVALRVESASTSAIARIEGIVVDLSSGQIHKGDRVYAFHQLPESVQRILDAGGLTAYLEGVAER